MKEEEEEEGSEKEDHECVLEFCFLQFKRLQVDHCTRQTVQWCSHYEGRSGCRSLMIEQNQNRIGLLTRDCGRLEGQS